MHALCLLNFTHKRYISKGKKKTITDPFLYYETQSVAQRLNDNADFKLYMTLSAFAETCKTVNCIHLTVFRDLSIFLFDKCLTLFWPQFVYKFVKFKCSLQLHLYLQTMYSHYLSESVNESITQVCFVNDPLFVMLYATKQHQPQYHMSVLP